MRRRRGLLASRTTATLERPAPAPATTLTDESIRVAVRTTPKRNVFGRREPTKREIAERAYFIYLARGGMNGDPVTDWVQAERELREELRRSAGTGRRF
jgi:hypothetical protein